MKKLKDNIMPSHILDNIIHDYKVINGYVGSGDLLSLLNATASLTSNNVHSLIFSFNEYKVNINNSKIVKEVFIMILNSSFMVVLETTVKQYLCNIPTKEDLKIMINFFISCLELLPNQSIKKLSLLYPCVLYFSHQSTDHRLELACESLRKCIEDMKIILQDKQKTIVIPLQTRNSERNILENMSVVPEYCDIFPLITREPSRSLTYDQDDDGNIKYKSVDEYLYSQFNLLKDEYLKPLRKAIALICERFFLKSPLHLDEYRVKFHENVIIEDLYPSQDGLVYKIKFDFRKYEKCFNFEDSTIYPLGSLICFTNNFFDTIHIAYVVEYDSDSTLMVEFTEDPIYEIINNNKFMMITTNIRNEARFLKKLQSLTAETFPYKEYLVFGSNHIKPPFFLDGWDFHNISSYVEGELDDSQNEAFVNGLRNNLTLIKGGPGTGKTFICMKMIKYIVENYQHKSIYPILVMCYTEEASTELVKDITNTVGVKNVIEISESSNNICNVVNIRKNWLKKNVFPMELTTQSLSNQREIESMEESLTRKHREIINCDKRLVSVKKLTSFMKAEHSFYFENNDLNEWLKEKDPSTKHGLEDNSTALCVFDKSKSSTIIRSIITKIGTVKPLSDEEYKNIESLEVDFDVRLRIYRHWLQKYQHSLIMEYDFEKLNYDNLKKEKELLKRDEYLHIIGCMKVIVMTTAMITKYSMLLDRLGYQIVIIKEATKVPEWHVLASLSMHCQQLIMFGNDDATSEGQETFPQTEENNVNLSLFDRFIANNCKYYCLKYPYRSTAKCTSVPAQCKKILNCGHICTMVSHTKTSSHKGYTCNAPCIKQCSRFVHQRKMLCPENYTCDEEIIVTLVCGHVKEVLCFQKEDIVDCNEICKKYLSCGHSLEFYCGSDILNYKCSKVCNKLIDCGHYCKKRCLELCKCEEFVECTLPCNHKKVLKCGVDAANALCIDIFEKQFDCGHTVKYKCWEALKNCNVEINRKLDCGHIMKVACVDIAETFICQKTCNVVLNCGHKCEGQCGECHLGRFHRKCNFRCKKYLKCGHECEKSCHPGFCPPCSLPCNKYCKHSICTSTCGEICDCKVCTLDCTKSILCLKCKTLIKCPKICGVTCSSVCKKCAEVNTIEMNQYYIMEPCNCKVEKVSFNPKLIFEGNDAFIECQNCSIYLDSPYEGVLLLFFKQEYSAHFQKLPSLLSIKWDNCLHKVLQYTYLDYDFGEILYNIKTKKLCIKDHPTFDLLYKCYEEIEGICKDLSIINKSLNLGKYETYVKKSLNHISKWLNPFYRRFGRYEQYIYNVEKSKFQIISELLKFMNSINLTEYALVHKSCFEVLNKLKLLEYNNEIECTEESVKEMKRNLWNKKQSTEEEDKFIDRIINAKDICKEFYIDKFSTEDKLKELKKLILRCHPDKNKSSRANEAVKIVLVVRQLLQELLPTAGPN